MMMTSDLSIDMETVRQWLEQGRSVTLLDVRPAEERAEWAIPGSIHVDAYHALKAGDLQALAGVTLPGDAPVVTICGAGKISLIAAQQRTRGVPAQTLIAPGHTSAPIPFDQQPLVATLADVCARTPYCWTQKMPSSQRCWPASRRPRQIIRRLPS